MARKSPETRLNKISKMLIEECQPESLQEALKERELEGALILSVDKQLGFIQAMESVYPKSEIRKCIIHQHYK